MKPPTKTGVWLAVLCSVWAFPEPAASGGDTDSPPSVGGITREQDARILPGPPGNLRADRAGATNTVRWQGTKLDISTGYRVYRRCPGAPWESIGEVEAEVPDTGWYEFSDAASAGCEYAISVLDHYGNEGPRSAAVEATADATTRRDP